MSVVDRTHQVRVMDAWPSGRFVTCTCTAQSAGSRDTDYLTAWTYQHLGIDPGPALRDLESLASGTWPVVPDGALF